MRYILSLTFLMLFLAGCGNNQTEKIDVPALTKEVETKVVDYLKSLSDKTLSTQSAFYSDVDDLTYFGSNTDESFSGKTQVRKHLLDQIKSETTFQYGLPGNFSIRLSRDGYSATTFFDVKFRKTEGSSNTEGISRFAIMWRKESGVWLIVQLLRQDTPQSATNIR